MATSEADVNSQHDDGHVSAQQWRWTALAGMASYIDAGSIVALAAGLALWEQYLGLSNTTLGLLTALGPNAFGAAIGALIGGRLGDLLGRKRIYQYNLLLYAFGILLIVFSVNLPMLLIGTFIVGVAVGADVPTSLELEGVEIPRGAPYAVRVESGVPVTVQVSRMDTTQPALSLMTAMAYPVER